MRTVASELSPAETAKNRDSGKPRRKRRFPYRKLEDLEQDIIAHEGQMEQLHHELTQSHVLRDGQRVKDVQAAIEALRLQLQTLYEHWEEAAELN